MSKAQYNVGDEYIINGYIHAKAIGGTRLSVISDNTEFVCPVCKQEYTGFSGLGSIYNTELWGEDSPPNARNLYFTNQYSIILLCGEARCSAQYELAPILYEN